MDATWTVRVAKHEEASRALSREACLLSKIADALPLPVPQPRVGRDATGNVVSLHQEVVGVELVPGRWQGLPEPARGDMARRMGAFLAALHGLGTAAGEACELPVTDPAADVARLAGRVEEEGDFLPPDLRDALGRRFAAYLEGGPGWAYEAAILHGDFGPGHVLVDPAAAAVQGVIDWGDARIGDPARDFIFVYEDWGPAFLDLAAEGYGLEPPERLLPRVFIHYLADQLAWTWRVQEWGNQRAVDDGVEALRRALEASASKG